MGKKQATRFANRIKQKKRVDAAKARSSAVKQVNEKEDLLKKFREKTRPTESED